MLAPWCANERWEFGTLPNGHAFAKVTGRTRCPVSYRTNILWWFRNDYQQQLSEAPWFHGPDTTVPGYMGPPWPDAQRQAAWIYQRNPLQNASLFVAGVADRNFTTEVVQGWNDALVIQRNDLADPATGLPGEGYQRHKLTLDDGGTRTWSCNCKNPTPTTKGFVHSLGCQPTGLFEIKWINTSWGGSQMSAPVSKVGSI